jgi:hypothetical protein
MYYMEIFFKLIVYIASLTSYAQNAVRLISNVALVSFHFNESRMWSHSYDPVCGCNSMRRASHCGPDFT